MPLDFSVSEPLTFGVELELMVLNTHDYNLGARRDGPPQSPRRR
jgi:hypothetical protein